MRYKIVKYHEILLKYYEMLALMIGFKYKGEIIRHLRGSNYDMPSFKINFFSEITNDITHAIIFAIFINCG